MAPIKDWPALEHPRAKLLARGAGALSDAELLAIFIRSGVRGKTALDVARGVLNELGGLRATLDSQRARFCRANGVSEVTFITLQASLELGRRHLESRLEWGVSLATPDDARRYLSCRLRSYPHEVFACLFLDNRNQVLGFEEMFRGTIDGATEHPREVVKRALEHNAAALIVAHDHPSGVAEPSHADRALTRRLVDAVGLVDTRLPDHLVIGDGEVVSFAERGFLYAQSE